MANPVTAKSAKSIDGAVDEELDEEGLGQEIDRPTEELVIGMVGAVGAGVSTASLFLKERLKEEYGYDVEIIKASDLIRANASKTATSAPANSGSARIRSFSFTCCWASWITFNR